MTNFRIDLSIWRLLVLALFHGVILSIASLFLQNLPWLVKGEDSLVRWSMILKRVALEEDESRVYSNFLFVNTSYSNQLVEKVDQEGFPLGNEAITDRVELANVLQKLNRIDKHRFLILDIFFEHSTAMDSLLKSQLEKLQRTVLAAPLVEGVIQRPIFENRTGLATVESLDGTFVKYRLVHGDSLKTIPIAVYEDQTNLTVERWFSFLKTTEYIGLNYFVPDIRISQFDLVKERKVAVLQLSDFDYLDDDIITQLVDNRIVVIGDLLSNDQIETLTGKISAPLLLANIYLSVLNGDHQITIEFFLFLVVSFFTVSIFVFLPDKKLRRKFKYRGVVIGSSFLLYLGIISFLSYLIFNKVLNVFVLSFYLILVNYFIELWFSKSRLK